MINGKRDNMQYAVGNLVIIKFLNWRTILTKHRKNITFRFKSPIYEVYFEGKAHKSINLGFGLPKWIFLKKKNI